MKAFVIHLSQVPQSLNSATHTHQYLHDSGLDAELFEGTYGWDAVEIFEKENRKPYPFDIKGEPIDARTLALYSRPGVMGCFHSHYRLWKRCIELGEPILIFEDDVMFERGFIPVHWNEILLLATGKRVYRDPFYQTRLYDPQGEPAAGRFKGKNMPGAVGYGITPLAAKKLTARYRMYYMPADNCMNFRIVKLTCHSHLMGRAAVGAGDNKQSLTKTRWWNSNPDRLLRTTGAKVTKK